MAPSEAVLEFRVPPVPHVARVVRDGVSEFAEAHGIGHDDLSHFLTALGEALANAIEHAEATGPIHIEVRIDSGSIVATVADDGVGFAPGDLGEPSLPDPTAERGRGLPIMRRCCDIFSITSERGKGTRIVIGRSFEGSAPQASLVYDEKQPA
jgi:anti-sigma regulatory factor (Ser/Thr protein kinase)